MNSSMLTISWMMDRIWTIILLILIQCLFKANSYSKHIERYSHPDIQHYKPLLFDPLRFELLVGARDYILILNLNDFDSSHVKRNVYLPPTTEKKEKCRIKGMKRDECHNFITTLLPIPTSNYKEKHILVCGTNAYSPECEIRRISDSFDPVSRSISLNAFSPHWNTTSLITSSGAFFYGGPLDLRGIDSSIIKQKKIFPSKSPLAAYTDRRIVRSAQHDSKWISADANFVFSFEYDQHVYFLFRETAVEYLNVGKRVYSRIGRVCKDDPGLREHWTSFLKARINCSLPGVFPFYFDEIQSVDIIWNDGTPTLYAIFNTPVNSIHGSAVCAFTMESIFNSFRGPFKYQKSLNHIWERIDDDHQVFECQVSNTTGQDYTTMRMNAIYQQMDDTVQPISDRPFIVSQNENFKFIAVNIIKTKYYDSVEVLYIATTDGKLLKYVKWPYLNESCLVDEMQLVDPNDNKILSMKFFKDTDSLYFGTEKEVIRVSVHQCHNYHNKTQCVQSGDPYCGWSETKMKCINAPGNNVRDETWIQTDQSACYPRWSKWFTCNEAYGINDGTCKCRKRSCQGSSERCYDGYEYEISNCTKNGGWSEWSPWSSCMPACGRGVQYRTRTCSNPVPSNNGKFCQGNSREEKQCENLPFCAWSQWSEWTNCSLDCNGFAKRTRQCLDFSGNPVDKDFCQGQFIDTMKCECEKKFEWTKWSITDLSINEIVQQRSEIVLRKGDIRPKNEQRVLPLKYCDQCGGNTFNFNGKNFLLKECSCDDEVIWSDWSDWSVCHNNIQMRERICLLINKDCPEHFKEIRYCQFPSIQSHSHHTRTELRLKSNWQFLIAAFILVILSSGLTAIAFLFYLYRQSKLKPSLIMNHTISTEPNTYEEPEKYRITTPLNGGNSTITRTSTLKRDFKNTSFRAKLDDSNY